MESKKILRFDIETASEVYTFEEWTTYPKRKLWEQKMEEKEKPQTVEYYRDNCGIYAEFSKIVCISMMFGDRITSLTGEEKEILEKFNQVLEKSDGYVLGGFNVFGFDIPYLRKRMVINGIVPHKKLCIQNEKPWECSVVDVMNIWKHTSFSCSLDLLSLTLFGESPKTDMSGNNVSAAFYAGNIDMVRKYCEGDVRFTARCYEAIVNPSENGKRATVSDKTSQNTGTNETKNAETPSEGMVNNPDKPVFTPGELLKQKSRGKEIVDKFEMAELYIAELENHYTISDELKSQLYSLRDNEKKKSLPSEPVQDDGLPF